MSEKLTSKEPFEWPRFFLIASVALGVGVLFVYPYLWHLFLGVLHFGQGSELYPFLDMHGRLAAFEAHRMGLDILHYPNPVDPMNRMSVKPTWPLALSFLGLGPQHLIAAGTVTILVFGGIIFSILKPTSWKEACVMGLLCFSPPILLGIERANDDLVYFSLLSLIPLCLKLKGATRFLLAWLVIFLLAPAKYYPGAAFALLLLEVSNYRLLFALFTGGAFFVGLYFWGNYEEILYLRKAAPQPALLFANGGALAFEALGRSSVWHKVLILLFGCTGIGIQFLRRWPTLKVSIELQRWFVLGYSVLIFCFLLNSNFDYRLIYVLPMLPLLFALGRGEVGFEGWGKLAKGMVFILVPIFWLEVVIMHGALMMGAWRVPHALLGLGLKNLMLWVYLFGATVLVATLLRPNLRKVWASMRKPSSD